MAAGPADPGAARRAELAQLLAPAGGGVYVVSTGRAAMEALQRRIYGLSDGAGSETIRGAWQASLEALGDARLVVLGIPSDCGAGFARGANLGPGELRRTLHARSSSPLAQPGVVDVGDVRVVPHLLAEDMLSAEQIRATRAALYGDAAVTLPASPLGIAERALTLLAQLAPRARVLVLGGDHSVAWPAFDAAERRAAAQGQRLGLLHFDAHTDLLPERLGVRMCFATWAYWANERLGRDGRLVQVGIRASAHDRAHWEGTLGVHQIRPDEVERRGVDVLAEEIVAHFRRLGVDTVYVSNDIDGTDERWAAATGTPEPGGLEPEFVRGLTSRVLDAFPLAGADLVEVAPGLGHDRPGEPARTLETAADYLEDLVAAALR